MDVFLLKLRVASVDPGRGETLTTESDRTKQPGFGCSTSADARNEMLSKEIPSSPGRPGRKQNFDTFWVVGEPESEGSQIADWSSAEHCVTRE